MSFALILIIIRYTVKVPNELFRKLLHLAAFSSVALFILYAETWVAASIVSLIFAIVVLPVLKILEKTWKGYANLFVQRRGGEVAISLVILFSMISVMIAVCWGFLNQSYLAITAVFMWGMGDASAALVGTRFGKHKTDNIKFADKKKSYEGSFAMLAAAAVVGSICLYIMTDFSIWKIITVSLITGLAGSYTELITKNGYDTVTVPIVNAIVLYLLLLI